MKKCNGWAGKWIMIAALFLPQVVLIIFFAAQKEFVKGISAGGVKS